MHDQLHTFHESHALYKVCLDALQVGFVTNHLPLVTVLFPLAFSCVLVCLETNPLLLSSVHLLWSVHLLDSWFHFQSQKMNITCLRLSIPVMEMWCPQ